MSRQAIQASCTALKIPYLVHFTRTINLPSILQHGLYPVGRAYEVGALPQINDQHRLDGHRDSSSLSIGFPNCQMLYKYRKENEAVDWVILLLQPSILWTHDCAFCKHNAADGRISSRPIQELKSQGAFLGMFEEIEGCTIRAEQKLKASDPTDVQAEVLVFGVIEPQLIGGVIFQKESTRAAHAHLLGSRRSNIHPNSKGLFASRKYARTWG